MITSTETHDNSDIKISKEDLFQSLDNFVISINNKPKKIKERRNRFRPRIPLSALTKNLFSLSNTIISVSPFALSSYGLNPLLILDPVSSKLIKVKHTRKSKTTRSKVKEKRILINPIPWLTKLNLFSSLSIIEKLDKGDNKNKGKALSLDVKERKHQKGNELKTQQKKSIITKRIHNSIDNKDYINKSKEKERKQFSLIHKKEQLMRLKRLYTQMTVHKQRNKL